MENSAGRLVDLYIPRKCSVSNKPIACNEHGSIQLRVCHVDENGVLSADKHEFVISNNIRRAGDSAKSIDKLFAEHKIFCVEGEQ